MTLIHDFMTSFMQIKNKISINKIKKAISSYYKIIFGNTFTNFICSTFYQVIDKQLFRKQFPLTMTIIKTVNFKKILIIVY